MPRKRKTSKKKSDDRAQQKAYLTGGFIIILAVFSLISLYSEQMGLFGEWASLAIRFLFGTVAVLFCILLFILGLSFITEWHVSTKIKMIVLSVLVFLMGMLYVYDPYGRTLSWQSRVNRIDALPVDGGFIGENVARAFVGLLGTVGSWIFMALATAFVIYRMLSDRQKALIKHKITGIVEHSKERLDGKKKEREKSPKKMKLHNSLKKEKRSVPHAAAQSDRDAEKSKVEIHDYMPQQEKKREKPLEDSEKERFADTVQTDVSEAIYERPPIDLLNRTASNRSEGDGDVKKNANIIEEVMENFNVDCHVRAINRGPSITSYELEPSPGVKISKIVSLHDNLSLSLASPDIRIEAPIPGKRAIGIEVPNKIKDNVGLREIIESREFKNLNSNVPLSLGKDVSGRTVVSSIDKMPHLLIAGATGSGKSVCINSILIGILYKSPPEEVRLILIDPKVVELGIYNKIPHLLIPVVTDAKKAAFALAWAVEEMEKRYKAFAESGVRDITGYNEKMKLEGAQKMPKIVIVVDELSDLMMVAAKEVEDYITRLAQMARAAGIHLILATQRPSVDVITGTIKANIPSRIAFSVSSSIDSRTILDMSGAERLLGKGDMLFYPSSYPKPKRIQGAFVSDQEVEKVLAFVKKHIEETDYDKDAMNTMEKKVKKAVSDEDPLLYEAIDIILTQEQASISFLQRKLKVGYARAARIVDQIEEMGIIGPHEGSKPRKLLMTKEQIEAMKEDQENI
ncbi:MAG: DNA translocase FtsK 4TM domain-containing protein [Peptoniphilus sp.]|nr:DNA translocase FtsK 4TM domain-containing protein [Peptoniphilus sp.]MDD7362984.1 DNA translocase FtsK 4TM domain-containing protein [Bacillota bacterium]MDY6044224.1 DNA translocase FtsK 4TM domain-containing protein [Peptoniphilus sp.]